ncbi:MAG TPA: gliding motility-associated C-terminal domain-containing protein [Chitinophagales bacterium]|nr:gliding motility-associated C-terminal domain-containing protein [Chitinophagales bacterium]
MNPKYLWTLILLLATASVSSQTFQLFAEDFDDDYAGSFLLNSAGPGDSIGNNQWIINDSYTGGFGYPNTPSQLMVESGTIGGAPYSTYLHVHDVEAAPAVINASYDPGSASDHFAEMAYGFCTLGLVDIEFTFFWIGEGSATAYGQVYYSADGGPWTEVGEPLYNEQSLWKYEVITSTDFEDVADLRFGFRWLNNVSGDDPSVSFAIDDIIAVGTYDALASPVDINITFLFPDPVCALSTLVFGWELSAPLCDGTYQVQLSNASGSFASPTDLGVFDIASADTSGAVAVVIPGTTPEGDCYKVRVVRLSPLPYIVGEASVCFEVQDCPNTITTLPPVVTYDTNAVCVNSVIDVPFFSTGVYLPGNVYTAQLSDSTGSFDSPYTIGTFTSSATYDPALGSMPGMVSGIVPVVPPGCSYFIRVVSSAPEVTGSVYGPLCIQECDIETNDITDIYVCISEEIGDTLTITYDTNVFDSIATYCPDNTFCVEILDAMFFNQASLCDLGITVDTESGTIELMIPGYTDLLALGLDAGVWYMRVIASCADPSENSLGTLIHLTIGAPADDPPVLIPEDTLFCEGAVIAATVVPYNPNSVYQFQFGAGTPFTWPFNPILINFAGVTGDVSLKVREINYGCPGPWSDSIVFHVIDVPVVAISGPAKACTGDTVTYSVPYFLSTYYDWSITGGTVVDTANNEISVVWDAEGYYTLTIFALNECGSGTGNKTIHIIPTIPIGDVPDQLICEGQTVNLNANAAGIEGYAWYEYGDTTLVYDDFYFSVTPDSTITYLLVGTDEEGCNSSDTVMIAVEYPTNEFDTAIFCIGTQALLDAGHPGSNYSWSTGATTQQITAGMTGIYNVTIDPADQVCNIFKEFRVEMVTDTCDPIVEIPNAFSPNNDGVNDFFSLYGAAVTDLDLLIYNRWGELVYETHDIGIVNNMQAGWDGTFRGEPQEMGAYAYFLKATGGSGNSVVLKGSVTLIR